MITMLISGKLFKKPEELTSTKSNKTYVKCQIIEGQGDESTFCNIVAFSDHVKTALLALSAGETISVSGEAKVEAYTDKHSKPKASISLTAQEILTVHHAKKKRDAMSRGGSSEADNESQQHESVGKSAEYYAPRNDKSVGQGKSSQVMPDDEDSIPF